MEIKYHGANCLTLSAKKVSVVVDDNLSSIGKSSVSAKANVNIFTQQRLNDSKTKAYIIDGPGEYEISGVSVLGLPAAAHTDHDGEHTATIIRVILRGVSVAILGHISPKLSDEQLEKLGMIDVLVVPVGGNGYTLDAKSAAKLIKLIEPKIIIPTHYKQSGVKYEVPQDQLGDFFKEVGATPEKVESLKLKAGHLPLDNQVYYELKV